MADLTAGQNYQCVSNPGPLNATGVGTQADGVTPGDSYEFRVRADLSDGLVTGWADQAYDAPIAPAPTVTASMVTVDYGDGYGDGGTSTFLRLAWDGLTAVDAGESVQVEVQGTPYPGTQWRGLEITDDDYYGLPGVQGYADNPGVFGAGDYTYRLRGVGPGGLVTAWSDPTSAVAVGDVGDAGPALTLSSTDTTVTATRPTGSELWMQAGDQPYGPVLLGEPLPGDLSPYGTDDEQAGTTAITVTGLTPGTTYYFVAGQPLDADDPTELLYTRSSVATTGTAPVPAVPLPNAPTDLVATLTGDETVFLHWVDHSTDEDGFDIYRSADPTFQTGVDPIATGVDANQYTDTLPDDTTTYYYRVYAYKAAAAAAATTAGSLPPAKPARPGDSTGHADTQDGGIRLQTVLFGGDVNRSGTGGSTVNLSGSQPVLRDNGKGAYAGPQWDDANANGTIDGGPSRYLDDVIDPGTNDLTKEHEFPVSYERTNGAVPGTASGQYQWTGIIATPTFAFAGLLGGALWVVRGQSNVTGIRGTTIAFGPAQLSQAGNHLSAVAYANQPLPDSIQSELMKIDWQVSFDGGKTWQKLGVGHSEDWLYVTGGPAPQAFETELWLGCTGANGQQPGSQAADDGVVKGIWGTFAGPANVTRIDGKPLTYYKDWTIQNTTAASLLKGLDGQCGSWSDLLWQCIAQQGAKTSKTVYIRATAIGGYGIAIDNFAGLKGSMSSPSINISTNSAGDPWNSTGYTWSSTSVNDLSGIPGQNTSNPLSMFGNHQFIENDGIYYDPSYGVTYASPDDFASKAVAGFWRKSGKYYYFWTIGKGQIVFSPQAH